MGLRLYVATALSSGHEFDLPADAARHAQVRRVQPGEWLTLFDGGGLDWSAEVLAMGRTSVRVRVGEARAVATELPLAVTLAVGMPANERMDALVEKAAELGAAAVQPLWTARSVLRLEGGRAERRRAHWQAVAAGACEQCGRARVSAVAPVQALAPWLAQAGRGARWLLSPAADVPPLPAVWARAGAPRELVVLSGPEGGFTDDEERAARAAGFVPASLGARVLRADTAPIAALAWIALAVTVPKSG